jgi:hypothetical protein
VYASVVHQNWNRHRKKETTENRQEGMYLSKGGRDIAGRTRGGRACTETKRNSWKRRVSRDELISLQRTGSESRRNILWRHRREAARGICAAMRADEAKGRPRGPYQLHSSASPCRRGPPGPTAAVKLRLRKQQYCPDVFSYNDKITKKKKKRVLTVWKRILPRDRKGTHESSSRGPRPSGPSGSADGPRRPSCSRTPPTWTPRVD